MDEDLFWEIIEKFNWEKEGKDNEVIESAVDFLSQCSIKNINAFQDILSEKLYHLHEIWDEKEKDTYKYGISDDPIEKDGLSKRVRSQLSLFNNIVNWARFIGRIILKNIPGRKKALEAISKIPFGLQKDLFGPGFVTKSVT